jgi:hypothetical protein
MLDFVRSNCTIGDAHGTDVEMIVSFGTRDRTSARNLK